MAWPIVGAARTWLGRRMQGAFGSKVLTPRFSKKGVLRGFDQHRREGWISKGLDLGWKLESWASLIANNFPQGQNTFSCRIIGQPQANLQNLFSFAVGAVWGALYSGNVTAAVSAVTFSASIDHKNKVVEVSVMFGVSGLTAPYVLSNLRTMMNRPIPNFQITSAGWPPFLYPVGQDKQVPGIIFPKATTVTDTPGLNPTLAFENGTRGYNNTLAQAAPLKETICEQPTIPGNTILGSGISSSQLDLVKKLFGG